MHGFPRQENGLANEDADPCAFIPMVNCYVKYPATSRLRMSARATFHYWLQRWLQCWLQCWLQWQPWLQRWLRPFIFGYNGCVRWCKLLTRKSSLMPAAAGLTWYTHTYTHTHTHTHTHTRTHTQTHIHTHKHTYTHTHKLPFLPSECRFRHWSKQRPQL